MPRSSRTRSVASLLLVGAFGFGCRPPSPADEALRARGPALASVARVSRVEVFAGYPGTWASRMVFRPPAQYGWSYDTRAEPYTYLDDGTTVRSFVGSSLVAEDASPSAPLRSHARFTAVMFLEALRRPDVVVTTDSAAPRVLQVRFPDGQSFTVQTGADGSVERIAGPLDLPGVDRGVVTALLSDYRTVGSSRLPHRIRFLMGERPFADEQVLTYCLDAAGVGDETFRRPGAWPACP